jgi:imidazolonepropionase-like amidohydrolase
MRISVLLGVLLAAQGSLAAQQDKPLAVEGGLYHVHLLLHDIGTEAYSVTEAAPDKLVMSTQVSTNDRGNHRSSTWTLTMDHACVPSRLEQESVPENPIGGALTEIAGGKVTVREGEVSRKLVRPVRAYVGFTGMPAAVEMMMMRYWLWHGRPAQLPILRASEKALPVEIKLVGHDSFERKGKMVQLARYTVANLVFGREIVWMNDSYRLAGVMTFAGGLPHETVLDEYEAVQGEMYHSGVQQEMLDLADLTRAVPVIAQGTYAIVGARLVDGTGAAPVERSTVVVRDGRIAAAGKIPAPAGMQVIHAEGQTLLPGLWEMHSHYSGVEFGPALLAAGVTTARDCGGEFEFLTTVRRKIGQERQLGPRLLLAGLIDSGGPLAFGAVDVETPAQAVAAVDAYADARFEQIKVYTQIQPEVLKAIAAEAHRRGLTVTGHVPAAMDAFEGVADGMDQINHLQFVTKSMLAPGSSGPVDLDSTRAKELIALLAERKIVVDPTLGWGEMAGHPRNVPVASFEPGIKVAPYTLAAKFYGLGVPAADEAKFRERMESNLRVVGALFRASVPIVAGSDTGLIGYGLDRELELYVQAGMTPMQAIQTATLGAAKAMRLESESGTVEVGKRADLVLVEGNPVVKIGDIRRVVSVVTGGRMYDSKRLARSVEFAR